MGDETQKCAYCGEPKTPSAEIEGRPVGYRCIPCEEKREKEIQERLEERARIRREAELQERIKTRLDCCGIGERFAGMVFSDYKPTDKKAEKILADCISYTESFTGKSGGSLLMIGSPGTGKNMLAAIICQELIKKDFECKHTTAMKLVRKIKDSWRDKEESEQNVINRMVLPHLLVIDEIGVQFGSATEQLYLTEVINERYEKRRPTILISNLKLSELTAIMGERIIDRFHDDGSKLMVFAWESYRRRAK
jgi:DNA replication protein DnaC